MHKRFVVAAAVSVAGFLCSACPKLVQSLLTEVFSLGRHPKEFFIQRFGASHFRLIGSTYFVFVDGCWVAVDVDGFVYTERIICAGDPEFIVVE